MPNISQTQFTPQVRYAGELTLVFRDKYTIIAKYGSTSLLFHRWYDRGRGDYAEKWKPFVRALKEQKISSLADCRQLAYKHDIDIQGYSGGLSLPRDIKVIEEKTNDSRKNIQRTTIKRSAKSPSKTKVATTCKSTQRTRSAGTQSRQNLSGNNKRTGGKK